MTASRSVPPLPELDAGWPRATASGHAQGWPQSRQRRLAARLTPALVGLLFVAMLIGPQPFSPHTADKAAIAESGNVFNRLVVFLEFGAAIPLALLNLERFLRLLARNWPVGATVAWSGLSMLWATHPDLAARRAFAFTLVYLTLVAFAACARGPGDWLVPLTLCFAAVAVFNVIAIVALPAISHSDIGEMGIYDNKNGAGTMAMLSIVVLATGLVACRGWALRTVLIGLVLLGWFFLLATRSKTSIGVAALMMGLGPTLYAVLGSRMPVRLAASCAALGLAVMATVAYTAAGYDDADLRLLLFGDLTFTGRTEIWGPVVREIALRPWLGHGFGSFWDVGGTYNTLSSAPLSAWFMNAQLINTAHDGYLDTLLQTGRVGLALAIVAIVRCCWLLGAAISDGTRQQRIALSGALCLVICLILNNFLESYLFRTGDPLGYLFMFIMLQAEAVRLRPPPALMPASSGVPTS